MIVREPVNKEKNLHPHVKERWEQQTQAPEPLTFKLHEMSALQKDLGDRDFLATSFRPSSTPLGPLETLPFQVDRTFKGNLPVYTDQKASGNKQSTVVRKIYGDVDAFKMELAKVVSNSPIEEK